MKIAVLLLLLAVPGDAPRVRINVPRGGWTSRRVATFAGTVSDRGVRALQLTLNGAEWTLNVRNGSFRAALPVRPGPNAVEAVAKNGAGAGRDRSTFFASVPPTDLQILLSWDTDGTDLDLHVTEPSGEECYYGNRRTAAGGGLEVDDVDGFGPEVYLLPHAPLGDYRIAVACYDAGRAVQTEAWVDVIVREGSPSEQRYRFPVTFTHEGETLELGGFRIDRPVE